MIKHMKYTICGMNKLLSFLLLITLISCSTEEQSTKEDLYFRFEINDSTHLDIKANLQANSFQIKNGIEKIEMKEYVSFNDHFSARFPVFESYIMAKKKGGQYTGYYIDSSRKSPYQIPFTSITKPKPSDAKQEITWKYHIRFSPKTANEFEGLGIFKRYNEQIHATVRTETGDYRFLSGEIQNVQFNIGCIDGSHVFTFKGEIKGDSIQGHFYSGKHWSTSFVGHVDIDYELQHADSLTQVVDSSLFDFNLPDLNGDTISFQNTYAESPAIVQILGSWCPNCMDETRYYVELQKQFPELKIIGVAFERSEITDTASMALNRMKSDLAINYDLLIGGISRKSVASETFPMLNKVISFPTSIFIDKKGVIRKVHTGFNGPSTGKVYEDYKTETESFIKKLLAE